MRNTSKMLNELIEYAMMRAFVLVSPKDMLIEEVKIAVGNKYSQQVVSKLSVAFEHATDTLADPHRVSREQLQR